MLMYSCSVLLINVLGLATCTRPSSTGTTALRVLVLVHVVLQPAVQIVATMSRHSDSSFQRQGRPDGCHRPPLAGLIAQHGGRGVLRRQLYADFLVCVVVVLLALLRGGESMSRQCRDILTAAFSAKGDLVVVTAPLWPALSPGLTTALARGVVRLP